MIEIVVGLLMYLNGDIVEHTYKEKMSECLKSKRIAEREVNPQSVRFSCKKLKQKQKSIWVQKRLLKLYQ